MELFMKVQHYLVIRLVYLTIYKLFMELEVDAVVLVGLSQYTPIIWMPMSSNCSRIVNVLKLAKWVPSRKQDYLQWVSLFLPLYS